VQVVAAAEFLGHALDEAGALAPVHRDAAEAAHDGAEMPRNSVSLATHCAP
jgi:hypothetical protein